MAKVTKKPSIDLLFAKNGEQIALLDGVKHIFNFDENDLAESIEKYTMPYDLRDKSGLHPDEYTSLEMASEIACEWNHKDVVGLILSVPANEIEDYRMEASYAA